MIKIIGFLVFFAPHFFLNAQVLNQHSLEEKPKLLVDGFSYPDFNDGSRYASFSLRYPLTNTTEIGVFGHHYRNLIAERFQVRLQIKQYVDEKIFLIGGYEQEWDLRNQNIGKPNGKPLHSIFYGVGHDIKPGLSLEAMIQNPINNPGFSPLGLDKPSSSFRLNTKFKF
ncbi:hypothetical protein LV716_00730 [Flagellimonas sp. HMM57]|uniref:hypothetical protein n=1 Tax=unclassified Flagellimonas TaxID=2644544 RepID=UPI0013D762BE|nr:MULTISPECIES: hypothetical protein [unclassified Flagellimonas]UII76348.1 hypothetical protein LV716_00730 [Flagellimonas sp. HMM57]